MKTAALTLLLTACADTISTPVGPLPEMSLTRTGQRAPSGVGTPATFVASTIVCDAPPFSPAIVEVRWTAQAFGAEHFLSAIGLSVTSPGENLAVSAAAVSVGGASLEANAPWVDLADVTISCTRKAFRFPRTYEQSLKSLIQVRADGSATVNGTPVPTLPGRPH